MAKTKVRKHKRKLKWRTVKVKRHRRKKRKSKKKSLFGAHPKDLRKLDQEEQQAADWSARDRYELGRFLQRVQKKRLPDTGFGESKRRRDDFHSSFKEDDPFEQISINLYGKKARKERPKRVKKRLSIKGWLADRAMVNREFVKGDWPERSTFVRGSSDSINSKTRSLMGAPKVYEEDSPTSYAIDDIRERVREEVTERKKLKEDFPLLLEESRSLKENQPKIQRVIEELDKKYNEED